MARGTDVLAGLALGIADSIGTGGLLGSSLYGVRPTDPADLGMVSALLAEDLTLRPANVGNGRYSAKRTQADRERLESGNPLHGRLRRQLTSTSRTKNTASG